MTRNKIFKIEKIIGLENEDVFHEQLHRLEHQDKVEFLVLDREDMQRSRFRAVTNRDTECIIALDRSQKLQNGSVLVLNEDIALVVRAKKTKWLRLKPAGTPEALMLGYFAGNMHWKVAFDELVIKIAVHGDVQTYTDRISHFIDEKQVMVLSAD